MGQKVNPNGLRIGINRGWSSQWYAERVPSLRILSKTMQFVNS